MIRRPPRSTLSSSSAASDVYKRQELVLLLGGILVHLGQGTSHDAVLDGKGVEVEHVLQHIFGLLSRWAFQVHPEEEVGIAEQGRHQEHIDVLVVQPALSCKYERANHATTHKGADASG